jgi:AsmA protein
MKRIVKLLFVLFLSLVAFLAIALAILPSLYQQTIETDVKSHINQKLDANVSFDHLSLRFYRHFPNLTLSLHDLLVLGKEEFKIDTLALVKEAQFEVNIFSLLSKQTEIKSIHLVDPLINIYVLKDGRANYNITKPSDTTSQPAPSSINIAIDQFSIENGQIDYHDWQKDLFLTASGIEHKGEGNFLNKIFDYKTITVIRHLSLNYDKVQYVNRKTIGIDLIMEMNLPETKFTLNRF